MRKWAVLGAAIVCEVAASLSLKGVLDRPGLYVVVVGGYLAAFAALARVLQLGMPLGVAYGIWGAAGVAATALLSAAVFGEQLTPVMLVGLVLVIAGVLLVELGSRRDVAVTGAQG